MTLKQSRMAIYALVTAPILIDALDGFLSLTLGFGGITALFRMAIILLCISFMSNVGLKYLAAFFCYLFLVSFFWSSNNGINSPSFWINFSIRPLYVALICLSLVKIVNKSNDHEGLYHASCASIMIVSSSFIISILTGISNKTYGDYAFGEKSFFDGGNDIGLFTLLMGVIMLRAFSKDRRALYHFSLITCIIPLVLLATRTSWAGAVIIIILYSIIMIVRPYKNLYGKLYTFLFMSSVFAFIGTVIRQIIEFVEQNQYLFDKFVNTLSEGPRELLTRFAVARIQNFDFYEILFGTGDRVHRELAGYMNRFGFIDYAPLTERFIEQDPLDIFVFSGLVGIVLIYGIHARLASRAITAWLRNHCRIEDGLVLLGCMLYILHSIVAGHAMLSPIVASAIAPLYALAMLAHRKQN